MATDALIQLQAAVTKTATFNGTAITLAGGTPRRGLNCRVIYSAASTSAGAGSVTLGLDISYDGGSTYVASAFQAPPLTLSTVAQAGELYIPFSISPTSVANGTRVRLSVEAISGTNATITYGGEISLARP